MSEQKAGTQAEAGTQTRESGELVREVRFTPAFDKRSLKPGKNYGIHGVTITFLVKGPLGAIQFVIYTNWQLPHVTKEFEAKEGTYPYTGSALWKPMAADLGYHSPKPLYEGQTPMDQQCEVLGGVCYYDGSGMQAESVFDLLLSGGDKAVWQRLEFEYHQRFEDQAHD